MKTPPLVSRSLLAFTITAGLSMTGVTAQDLTSLVEPSTQLSPASWEFIAFESDGADLGDLDEIILGVHLLDTGTGVEIRISNDSVPGDDWVSDSVPTITALYFENTGGLLMAPSFSAADSIGTVDYSLHLGGNLPGGTNIDFDGAFSFQPARPPVVEGIDPNEVGSFFFEGSSYDEIRAALDNGDLRIGAHVQQIGANADGSASFVTGSPVTQVPEPGTTLLALLGSFLLLRRRR